MSITVLRIAADGTAWLGEIDRSHATFQGLLGGGWLEGIRGHGWYGYCDEEGKAKGLPVNAAATALAKGNGWPHHGDVLCGPVVFFGADDAPGAGSVPPALVEAARALDGIEWLASLDRR